MNFLDKSWLVQLSSKDIRSQHEVNLEKQVKEADEQYKKLEKENESLKKSQETLKRQVTSLSDQVRKAQTDGYCTSRGQSHTKSPSDFSSRYQRILKKKRTDQCSDSLAWLEAEGYSAVKLSLWNEKTKKLEQIYFSKDDLLGPDEGMCEYFTLYSVMNCNHCRCCCVKIRNRCFEHDDLCERQV